MDLSAAILGTATVKGIRARQDAAVLVIGRDRFDRHALAAVGCYHYVAAATLSRLIASDVAVADTRALFDTVAPERLVLPRLGPIALAVLGAAFEIKGLGGDTPLASWYRHHDFVRLFTFDTLKTRHAAQERAAARRRRSLTRARESRRYGKHADRRPSV